MTVLRQQSGELPLGQSTATTDTDILTSLLGSHPDLTLEAAAMLELPLVRGAFSLVFMDETTLFAARDPQGIRPLVLGPAGAGLGGGQRDGGAGHRRRDGRAGDRAGRTHRDRRAGRPLHPVRRSRRRRDACSSTSTSPVPTPPSPVAACRRPGSPSAGRWRGSTRWRPISSSRCPESGRYAAIGYAQESGLPFAEGLVKNAYVGRTFIQPSQTIRQLGIRLKLNPLREVIAGQAAGRRRRLDRSGQHAARHHPDAARGGRRRRCTCGSPPRRCSGHASTASTSRPAPNSSPTA